MTWPGRLLWRRSTPSSVVDFQVTVAGSSLPELVATMRGESVGQFDVHLTWAEAHTLTMALTDWLWRTHPMGPDAPPAAPAEWPPIE
jgi:hypothetical protein